MSALLLFLLAQAGSPPPEDLEQAYQRRITPTVEVVQAAKPAVVHVETDVPRVARDVFGWRPYRDRNSGSGVVVYEDGYIVTNFHVVRGAERIRVSFDPAADERSYPAKLLSWDADQDLALLKVDGEEPFSTVPLGTSSDLLVGETVIAIGNPYGQTLTVSTGIISGLHRNIQASGLSFEDLVQTDASINPGNSGGPLLNINGELIGINTAMNLKAENIGFAIPVDTVRRVLRDHLLSPTKARSWLGFDVDVESLTVCERAPGGPADEAGLREGDRVVAVDGKSLSDHHDWSLARVAVLPDQEVSIRYRREGREDEARLRAWTRVEGLVYERAGLRVDPVKVGYRPMLLVRAVRPGGPADAIGIRRDDFLQALRPRGWRATRLRSPDELAILLSRLEPGTRVEVELYRDENEDGVLEFTPGHTELKRGTIVLD